MLHVSIDYVRGYILSQFPLLLLTTDAHPSEMYLMSSKKNTTTSFTHMEKNTTTQYTRNLSLVCRTTMMMMINMLLLNVLLKNASATTAMLANHELSVTRLSV